MVVSSAALFSHEVSSFPTCLTPLCLTSQGSQHLLPKYKCNLVLFYSRACCGSPLPSAPFLVPTLFPSALLWVSCPQDVMSFNQSSFDKPKEEILIRLGADC